MSVKQMTRVWEHSKADGAVLLVALALADRADDDGFCYPGVESLAKKCRVSVRSVQRHISALCEIGELQVSVGKGVAVKGGSTNRYRITVNAPEHSGTSTDQSGANLAPGDKKDTEVVTGRAGSGDTALSPNTSVEPSVDTLDPQPPEGAVIVVAPINSKRHPTTELPKRIAKLFNRRESTGWSDKELRAWRDIARVINDEDMALVEVYYATGKGKDGFYLRREPLTFMRNYRGEVDKARAWDESGRPIESNIRSVSFKEKDQQREVDLHRAKSKYGF